MSKKNKQEQVEQPQVDAVADGVQATEQAVEQVAEQVQEQARDMTFAEVMAWNAANRDKTSPVHVVQEKQQRKMMRF